MAHQIEQYAKSIGNLQQAIKDLAEIIDLNSNKGMQEDIVCAHDIAISMLLSNISLYNISTKPMSFDLKNITYEFYCFKTPMILCRESFEKLLLFSSIYGKNLKIDEYEYLIWRICSYSHANKMKKISDESIENYNNANLDLIMLIDKLKTTSEFLSKNESEQRKLITRIQNGKNNKNYKTILTRLGLEKLYAVYEFLCEYAHSGFLSVSKTVMATDINDQRQNSKFAVDIGVCFVYIFIKKYCDFFALNVPCDSENYDDISFRVDLYGDIANGICNIFKDK